MSAITRWVLAHKRIVTLFWVALTVVGIASANSATKALDQKFSVPGKEGWETNVAIAEHFHGTGGDTAPLVPVVTLPAGETVDSPGVRAQLPAGRSTARVARCPTRGSPPTPPPAAGASSRRTAAPRSRSSIRSRTRIPPSARTRTRPRRHAPPFGTSTSQARRFTSAASTRCRTSPAADNGHGVLLESRSGRLRRPDRARVRVRLLPGPRADRDGDRVDHDHLPAGLGPHHVHRHLAGRPVPDRPGRARGRDRLLAAGRRRAGARSAPTGEAATRRSSARWRPRGAPWSSAGPPSRSACWRWSRCRCPSCAAWATAAC